MTFQSNFNYSGFELDCLGIWTKPSDGTRCESLCIRPAMIQVIRLIQRQGQADLPRVTESLVDFLSLAQAKLSGNLEQIPPTQTYSHFKWYKMGF